MAQRKNYPNSSWKIYRNTPSFVPKPGDIVCWTYGWAGHTGIVVGPSDKKTFRTVDQNWFGANQYSGSRALMLNILIAVWVVISISLDLHTKRLTIVHQLKTRY